MIEIFPKLLIGNEQDFELQVKNSEGWSVVHACKEPYHRQLLGYRGRGAPKNHPEYFLGIRGNRLFANLVDAPNPAYIPKIIIDECLGFTKIALESGNKVLVHCNKGESRSPSIGLLFLVQNTTTLPTDSLETAETEFRKIYPPYNPSPGIRGFMKMNWNEYAR